MYQQLFSLQEEVFKVLANSKRLEIIQLLDDRELSVTQMGDMLGLPQSNLSQHLSLLRQAKIVSSRRDAQTIYYRLSDPKICQACDLVKEMLRTSGALPMSDKVLMESQEALYPIVTDPVCGMRLSVSRAGESIEHGEKHYYFCASGCKSAFEKDSTKFVKKEVIHG